MKLEKCTFDIDPAQCRPPLAEHEKGGWALQLKLPELEKPLDPNALFGRPGPFHIEVGCGSGLFMATYAARHQDWNHLGIEWDYKQVKRSEDKWRRRNLLNTRIVHCDAHYFLEDYVDAEAVDAYTILYSDPWFKKRHHKRRFFQPRLLPILERTMKSGSPLFIKTDVTSYYEVIVELLDGAPFLEKERDGRLDLEPDPGDIQTNYQRKAQEAGHPLHLLQYRRR